MCATGASRRTADTHTRDGRSALAGEVRRIASARGAHFLWPLALPRPLALPPPGLRALALPRPLPASPPPTPPASALPPPPSSPPSSLPSVDVGAASPPYPARAQALRENFPLDML